MAERKKQNRPAHKAEIRAKVMALLMSGAGVIELAKEFNLPKQTVSRWRIELGSEKMREVLDKNKEHFAAMFAYNLHETMVAQASLLEHFGDKEWQMRQNAHDLGVLFGICGTKSVEYYSAMMRFSAPPKAMAENAGE